MPQNFTECVSLLDFPVSPFSVLPSDPAGMLIVTPDPRESAKIPAAIMSPPTTTVPMRAGLPTNPQKEDQPPVLLELLAAGAAVLLGAAWPRMLSMPCDKLPGKAPSPLGDAGAVPCFNVPLVTADGL